MHAIASRGGWDTDGQRVPVPFERLELLSNTSDVLYRQEDTHRREPDIQCFEPTVFLARLLQHIPQSGLHQVHYYGRYSNVARARRSSDGMKDYTPAPLRDEVLDTAERCQARRSWAQLIRRVYEVDPLICQACGGPMRVVALLLEPTVIHKILAHLARQARLTPRSPPPAASAGRVRAAF